MTGRPVPAATTQPELPLFFGRRPDEVIIDVSGAPYRSTRQCFAPGDDQVFMLVKFSVGKCTMSPGDGSLTFRQSLHAITAYPIDPEWGAERLEQLAIAHEHREDQHRRDVGKATAGRMDFAAGDPRVDELIIDPDAPHEFAAGLDADSCALPECGRPPADPLHHVDPPTNPEETDPDAPDAAA